MDSTSRLLLSKPDSDPLTGDFVDIDVLNANMDKIDNVMGTTVCTSVTRPATPFDGQLIRETDTGLVYVMNGNIPAWEEVLTENSNLDTSAVTICTSTTRPGSPYDGQLIRETNTKKMYVWNATQALWDEVLTVNSTLSIPALVRCRIFTTVNVPTANNTLTLVPFGGESFDGANNMHAPGSSKIILPSFSGARAFQIEAAVGFVANATGRRVLTLRKNAGGSAVAGTQIGVVSIGASPSSGTDVQFSDCQELSGGDEIEMFILQNSGVSLDASAGEYTTRLGVRQVY